MAQASAGDVVKVCVASRHGPESVCLVLGVESHLGNKYTCLVLDPHEAHLDFLTVGTLASFGDISTFRKLF